MQDNNRSPSTRDPAPNDEPEPASEESIPSDGRDPVGEKMIEELGRAREPKQAQQQFDAEPMPEQFPVS